MQKEIDKILEEIKEKYNFQNENNNQFDEQRYNANKQILDIIKEYIEENPKQRFIQVLWNLDIVNNVDRYNEEPDITLKRIKTRLENIHNVRNNINSKKEN